MLAKIVRSLQSRPTRSRKAAARPHLEILESRTVMSMVSVTPSLGLSTTKAGGQASFSVFLSAPPLSNVSVPIQVSNAMEASLSTPTLVFTSTNWNTPQTVVVTGLDDHANGDTPYTIVTNSAVSSDVQYQGTKPNNVAIVNSDAPRRKQEAAAQQEIAMLIQADGMGGDMTMGGMPMSPDMMGEQNTVTNLVDLHKASAIAIQSGNWSDPGTWQNRVVPGTGANVWIMPGRTVKVDDQFVAALHTIRVTGVLTFATDANSSLRVDTLVVDPAGYLEMGTSSRPIGAAYTATVSFTDGGAIDRTWDPGLFSRGLINLGKVGIHGRQTTGHVALGKVPIPGDTQLVLAQSPTSWNPGDHIVLPGTSFVSNDDENFVILATSSDGMTLTLDHAVANTRFIPDPSLSLYVANTTRNVVFTSEAPGAIDRRGHIMFMHTLDVNVEYASFNGLGRTDKSVPTNDVGPGTTYNLRNQSVPNTGSNPRGRYSVHFHHSGGTLNSVPARLIGSVVLGSPGWGIVNHSSDVSIDDNVAVGVFGAGFATENGDELGSFTNNIAIRGGGRGVAFHATPSEFYGDLGYSGSGFWFQGLAAVTVSGNIATGSNQGQSAGFIIQQTGLYNTSNFPVANLSDPSVANGVSFNWHGVDYASVSNLPSRPFLNNTVYGSTAGVQLWYERRTDGIAHPGPQSVYEGLKVFDVSEGGFQMIYSSSIAIKNSAFYGNYGTPYEHFRASGTVGIGGNSAIVDIQNTTVVGFYTGYVSPSTGINSVQGGYFDNYLSVVVTKTVSTAAMTPSLVLNITGVDFGRAPHIGNQLPRFRCRQYDVSVEGSSRLGPWYSFGIQAYFEPMTIRIDGKQLYFPEQATNYQLASTGTELDGLTNGQAFAKYGIKVRGSFTPDDALDDSRIRGAKIGSPSTGNLMFQMASSAAVPISQRYQLAYINSSGNAVVDQTYIPLKKGLNFIIRKINGASRTFIVNAY